MISSAPIDFYFDFVSPFGWIAAERIGAIARDHRRSVAWHPLLLKVAVVDVMGLRPILDTPLKGPYSWHDAHRSARLHGLAIAKDVVPVFSSVVASRAVVWANHNGLPAEALVLALYRRHWRDGGDISKIDQVCETAAHVGFDRDELASAVASQTIKDGFRAEVDVAITSGVFGSPTMVVDGEMFWGSDRLGQVDRWLRDGPW